MKRFAVTICAMMVATLCLGVYPPPAHAAVRSCAVIRSLQTTLTRLQKVVDATPRLSARQVKERTNAIKFREMSLELGANKSVVPKNIDASIAQVVSSIRHAVDLRARRQTGQYQRALPLIHRQMNTAWDRFRQFRGSKRC